MLTNILAATTGFITQTISVLGYPGVLLLMVLQTIAVPIPSEVILPFAGFLASVGRFNIWLVALAGALGSVLGSWTAYYIGQKGGRPLVEKYGRYLLISKNDLAMTESFFNRFESPAIFFGQLLPVIRSFIAFFAGIAKAEKEKFTLYTFLGSFLWSLALAYVGQTLGENWLSLRDRLHNLDTIIVVLIGIGIAAWIYRHIKNR